MRHKYGEHNTCRYCGQDIENHGRRQWLDRGGNRPCVPFIECKTREIIVPRTKHAPLKELK